MTVRLLLFGGLGRARIFSLRVMMAFTPLTFCALASEVSSICCPLDLTEAAKEIFLALGFSEN